MKRFPCYNAIIILFFIISFKRKIFTPQDTPPQLRFSQSAVEFFPPFLLARFDALVSAVDAPVNASDICVAVHGVGKGILSTATLRALRQETDIRTSSWSW